MPAEVPDFFLVPVAKTTSLLEVTVEKRDNADAYINPDVPDHIGDDEEDEYDFEVDDDECEDPECECHHHHHHHNHIS